MSYHSRTSPRTNETHFGIEIECFAKDDTAHKAMRCQSVAAHDDGSLPDLGCEFKLCSPIDGAITRAVNLAVRLSNIGARVDSSCGLHVHIDTRQVPSERRVEFWQWLQASEPFWFSIVPASRRGRGFVASIQHEDYRWAAGHHYAWAHPTTYQTLEIRLHPGTVNPHKLYAWLLVCKRLSQLMQSGQALPAMPVRNSSASLGPMLDYTGRPRVECDYDSGEPSFCVIAPQHESDFSYNQRVNSWMRDIFSSEPEALEYLEARRRGNGNLERYAGATTTSDND